MHGQELHEGFVKKEHALSGKCTHLCGGMNQPMYLVIELSLFTLARSISVQLTCFD